MKKILFKLVFYIVLLSSLIVFIYPEYRILYGKIAFYLLIIIMFSRPLRDIFPQKLRILNKIVSKRKELGIIIGIFALVHGISFFTGYNMNLSIIYNPGVWKINNFLAWGILAFIIVIPLLLTSNIYSMIKLGKYWKKLHILAYFLLIFTALHVAFISGDKFPYMISLIVFYLFVLFMAYYLKKKRKKMLDNNK